MVGWLVVSRAEEELLRGLAHRTINDYVTVNCSCTNLPDIIYNITINGDAVENKAT